MAKQKSTAGKVNKSELVRKFLAGAPDASIQEIIASFRQRRIKVSDAVVKKVKYASGKPVQKPKRHAVKAASRNGRAVKGGPKLERGAKAQAIRDAFKSLGLRARPIEVIAAVAEHGITVSSAAVIGVRDRLKKQRRLKKAARLEAPAAAPSAPATASDSFTLEHLIEAKNLARQLGGIDAARQALAALASLQ